VRKRVTTSLPTSNKYKLWEIAMFNLQVSLEQSSREQQELDRINDEAGLNTDSYSEGYFEGYIGAEPSHPEQHSYWAGYQIGSREYWAKKLSVLIPTEF